MAEFWESELAVGRKEGRSKDASREVAAAEVEIASSFFSWSVPRSEREGERDSLVQNVTGS